jgi:predicted unusual protein kinase regulating ubiquinone biosynthesis (AarF/ABC1/UbiB family)
MEIPDIHYNDDVVIVMDKLKGTVLSQAIKHNLLSEEASNETSQFLWDIFMYTFFIEQHYQGDSNPGNFILLEETNQIGLIDFGCMPKIEHPKFAENMIRLFDAFSSFDNQMIFDAITEMGWMIEGTTMPLFESSVKGYCKVFNALLDPSGIDFSKNKKLYMDFRIAGGQLNKCINVSGDFPSFHRAFTTLIGVFTSLKSAVNLRESFESVKKQFQAR